MSGALPQKKRRAKAPLAITRTLSKPRSLVFRRRATDASFRNSAGTHERLLRPEPTASRHNGLVHSNPRRFQVAPSRRLRVIAYRSCARRSATVVQSQGFRGNECAVVAVHKRVHAQCTEAHRKGITDLLQTLGGMCCGRPFGGRIYTHRGALHNNDHFGGSAGSCVSRNLARCRASGIGQASSLPKTL